MWVNGVHAVLPSNFRETSTADLMTILDGNYDQLTRGDLESLVANVSDRLANLQEQIQHQPDRDDELMLQIQQLSGVQASAGEALSRLNLGTTEQIMTAAERQARIADMQQKARAAAERAAREEEQEQATVSAEPQLEQQGMAHRVWDTLGSMTDIYGGVTPEEAPLAQEVQGSIQEAKDCIICSDPITPENACRFALPCGHQVDLHDACLRTWLNEADVYARHKSTCPMCRTEIPQEILVQVRPRDLRPGLLRRGLNRVGEATQRGLNRVGEVAREEWNRLRGTYEPIHINSLNQLRDLSSRSLYRVESLDLRGIRGSEVIDIAMTLSRMTNLKTLKLTTDTDSNWFIGGDLEHLVLPVLREGNNRNLREIDLSRNQINNNGARAIADAFVHLPHLESLVLENNWIGEDGAIAILNAMNQAPSLRSLRLGNNTEALNQVFASYVNRGILSLQAEGGADIHIHSFPALIVLPEAVLYRVRAVKLFGIIEGELTLLSAVLGQMTSLDALVVNGSPSGVLSIIDVLRQGNNRNLRTLDLRSNNIDDNQARALAGALEYLPNLELLDLINNAIEQEGAIAILNALDRVPALQHFELRDNSQALDQVFANYARPNLDVRVGYFALVINSIGELRDFPSRLLYRVKIFLSEKENITEPFFAEALSQMVNLKKLVLVGCEINPEEMQPLIDALGQRVNLEALNIVSNQMSDSELRAIAGVLSEMPHLKELVLVGPGIGDDGVDAIVRALGQRVDLEELAFGGDNISGVGTQLMINFLAQMRHVKGCGLSGLRIGDEEVRAVVTALGASSSLAQLAFGGNIGIEGAMIIAAALSNKPHLRVLALGNNIGYEGARAIVDALAQGNNPEMGQIVFSNIDAMSLTDEQVNSLGASLNATVPRFRLSSINTGDRLGVVID